MTAYCPHDLDPETCATCLFGFERRGPGRPPEYDWKDLRERLFDYLPDESPGVTLTQIQEHLDVPEAVARQVIGQLRDVLGGNVEADDEDYAESSINVVVEPEGQRWGYWLEATLDEASPWAEYRLKGLVTMLRRVHSVALSLARSVDGRTTFGRASRRFERATRRLHEDAKDLLTEVQERRSERTRAGSS